MSKRVAPLIDATIYSQRQMASDATEEQLSADRVVPLSVGLLINSITQPARVERELQRGDVETIRSARLDVLVRLGIRIPRGEIARLGRLRGSTPAVESGSKEDERGPAACRARLPSRCAASLRRIGSVDRRLEHSGGRGGYSRTQFRLTAPFPARMEARRFPSSPRCTGLQGVLPSSPCRGGCGLDPVCSSDRRRAGRRQAARPRKKPGRPNATGFCS